MSNSQKVNSRQIGYYKSKGTINQLQNDLLTHMIDDDTKVRPCADGILKNPYFWSNDEILEFLKLVRDVDKPDKADDSIDDLKKKGKNTVLEGVDWKLFKGLEKNQINHEKALKILNENEENTEFDGENLFDLIKFIINVVSLNRGLKTSQIKF